MKDEILVPMDPNLARQLMEALKRAANDREGHPGFWIGINLATEVRMALGKAGI